MRNSQLTSLTCSECEKQFAKEDDAKQHFHAVNTVSTDPLSYLLLLPPTCQPGTMDAARAFAQAMKEVREKHPDKRFSFNPFSFYFNNQQGSGATLQLLDSILAVVE